MNGFMPDQLLGAIVTPHQPIFGDNGAATHETMSWPDSMWGLSIRCGRMVSILLSDHLATLVSNLAAGPHELQVVATLRSAPTGTVVVVSGKCGQPGEAFTCLFRQQAQNSCPGNILPPHRHLGLVKESEPTP
jgi:hypothetical protein